DRVLAAAILRRELFRLVLVVRTGLDLRGLVIPRRVGLDGASRRRLEPRTEDGSFHPVVVGDVVERLDGIARPLQFVVQVGEAVGDVGHVDLRCYVSPYRACGMTQANCATGCKKKWAEVSPDPPVSEQRRSVYASAF